MDDFLLEFFPGVYARRHSANTSNYCLFDSQVLTLFTSSLYLATLLTALLAASAVTRARGRKASIAVGGLFFLLGSALDAAARNLAMLLAGRIALGIGLGFTCQVLV
jgi:MFS family permease